MLVLNFVMTLHVLTCVSNDNRFSIWTDPDILRLAELTLDAEKSTIFVFKKYNKFVFKKYNKFVFKKGKKLSLKKENFVFYIFYF